MPPAARITDMHTCPMQTPAFPSPIPHVGGPIVGPGSPTVLIGGLPASVAGDTCTCVGPPDTIVKGSMTVMINSKPSVRIGDTTAHGGNITVGLPTVIIGG
ncbi:MAG: type VI secretion protein [Planctomycetes bacterium]|nr:type VI secretion protein [Planctomycetota bacterium]